MEDSCVQGDKLSHLLEQGHTEIAKPEKADGSSLLRKTLERYQKDHLKYKYLVENSPDAIFVADAETGLILEANHKAAELTGVSLDQIIGMHQSQIHPPEDVKKYREIFQKGLQKDSPHVTENIYVQRKDGTKIAVQINALTVQIGNQKVIYGIFRDMTEQKKLLEQLEISRERFRRLSQATFEGIVFHDNGKFVDSNQQFADMLGYSLDEISEMDGYGLFSPESHKVIREKIATGDKGPYEAICVKKDGSTVPVEIRARTVQLEGKETRVAAIRDMTEQKEMQQRLTDSERRYKDLYDNAKAALYRTRLSDGKILSCNTAMTKMIGFDSIAECLKSGYLTSDAYVDKNRRQTFINAIKKNKATSNFQAQVKRIDGVTIWISITAEIFPEQGWLEGTITDITASKVLTQMEMKILKIILAGKSNKEIAYGLDRSVRTIEDHRSHIMHKLGVDNVVDLTRKALQYGITPDGK